MTSEHMSWNDAIELARRTGDTEHVKVHLVRERLASLLDNISDFLDDVPDLVLDSEVARLDDAQAALRQALTRGDRG